MCQFLDMEEGESKVNNLVTEDQLDMLLCMLPLEETFKWRQWRGDGSPDDMPLTLCDPKEGAVSVLSSTPRYGAVPVTVPASLPCQRMHEDAP